MQHQASNETLRLGFSISYYFNPKCLTQAKKVCLRVEARGVISLETGRVESAYVYKASQSPNVKDPNKAEALFYFIQFKSQSNSNKDEDKAINFVTEMLAWIDSDLHGAKGEKRKLAPSVWREAVASLSPQTSSD